MVEMLVEMMVSWKVLKMVASMDAKTVEMLAVSMVWKWVDTSGYL